MATSVSIMGGNLIEIACAQYGDATAFINILQANEITDDWFIGQPVITSILASAPAGTNTLVVAPTNQIEIEDLVSCPSIRAYSVVTSVTQNYQSPGGQAFCLCKVAGEPMRILPNLGEWLSTTVTIAPSLDEAVNIGTPITFGGGQGKILYLPPASSQNGLPS